VTDFTVVPAAKRLVAFLRRKMSVMAHSVTYCDAVVWTLSGGNADINQQAFVTFYETPP